MATKKPSTDLTAEDFGKIRNMVRVALLHRGIPVEQVNELMQAYRTMQPVFSAATKFYKDEGSKDQATKAADTASAYLKGEFNTAEAPF